MHCVLITGATGVIGSELVPWFVEDGRFHVRLLLRASGPEHLQERVAELYRYWEHDAAASRRWRATCAISGSGSTRRRTPGWPAR